MKWFGKAGHFICADRCLFHLTTTVCDGAFLVSTVGEYYPLRAGDTPQEIGCDRMYETMVFRAGAECPCGCGQPQIDGMELDMHGYNDAKSATEGHMAMCEKWDGCNNDE